MRLFGYAREEVRSAPALAGAWLTLPLAVGRAFLANRHRMGNQLQFLTRRAAFALKSSVRRTSRGSSRAPLRP